MQNNNVKIVSLKYVLAEERAKYRGWRLLSSIKKVKIENINHNVNVSVQFIIELLNKYFEIEKNTIKIHFYSNFKGNFYSVTFKIKTYKDTELAYNAGCELREKNYTTINYGNEKWILSNNELEFCKKYIPNKYVYFYK